MGLATKKRVVVTGVGAVSPLGLSATETWKNGIAGKSGLGRITHFDPTSSPVQIAAEVKGYDLSTHLPSALHPKDARKVGRFAHFGITAGFEAYADSGLEIIREKLDPTRLGVSIGVGMGGLPEIESVHNDFLSKGYRRITPFFITQTIPNLASGMLSILLNLKGPNLCHTTACASSAHSIGEAFQQIRRGDADVVLAGGSEAVICPMGIGGFAAMRALSTRNDAPEKASRPYDVSRDGFVMGEGGAVLVLEEFEHARKRGAKIYGELVGYGLSADAFHITSPAPDGEGGGRAMDMALKEAGISGSDVSYVNTHGTSTPAGDLEESRAVSKRVDTKKCFVSSTKSMTGHLLGAAGALEAFFSLMALKEGIVPPTINLDTLDPECAATGLHFTPHHAVNAPLQYALSNSFGFGGTNASLLFRKNSRG